MSVRGRLPSEMGKLSELVLMRLTRTGISGTIPLELMQHRTKLRKFGSSTCTTCSRLLRWDLTSGPFTISETLLLQGSLFSGTIPSEVGNLTRIGTCSARVFTWLMMVSQTAHVMVSRPVYHRDIIVNQQ